MATIGSLVIGVHADAKGFTKELKKAQAEVNSFAKLAGTAMKGEFLLKGVGQALKFAEKMPDAMAGMAGWANQMSGTQWFDAEALQRGFRYIAQGREGLARLNEQLAAAKEADALNEALSKINAQLVQVQSGAAGMEVAMAKAAGVGAEGLEKITMKLAELRREQQAQDEFKKAVGDAAKFGDDQEAMLQQLAKDKRQAEGAMAGMSPRQIAAEELKLRGMLLAAERKELDLAVQQADEAERLNAELQEKLKIGKQMEADFQAMEAAEVAAWQKFFDGEGNFGDKKIEKEGGLPQALIRGSAAEVSARNKWQFQADNPQKKILAAALGQKKAAEEGNKKLDKVAQLLGAMELPAVIDF